MSIACNVVKRSQNTVKKFNMRQTAIARSDEIIQNRWCVGFGKGDAAIWRETSRDLKCGHGIHDFAKAFAVLQNHECVFCASAETQCWVRPRSGLSLLHTTGNLNCFLAPAFSKGSTTCHALEKSYTASEAAPSLPLGVVTPSPLDLLGHPR
mmetsp:Transcript_32368/g.48059  ORF Transcript_32368/g.48059 Transcript_32368/m.48059 type:complete len:152 (+) Transcript_32368:404-859(+)